MRRAESTNKSDAIKSKETTVTETEHSAFDPLEVTILRGIHKKNNEFKTECL
jgi:hypothetical protein